MSAELKLEKDQIHSFMHKYIFEHYKHTTDVSNLLKTTSGYSLYRRCQKSTNKDCKSRWVLSIDIKSKSASLECNNICNHVANSISKLRATKSIKMIS